MKPHQIDEELLITINLMKDLQGISPEEIYKFVVSVIQKNY